MITLIAITRRIRISCTVDDDTAANPEIKILARHRRLSATRLQP